MKMRTARTAGLIGGLATGALLLAGTAAQAAGTDTTTPEALGGLPAPTDVTGLATGMAGGVAGNVTDKVPGLGALNAVPGLDAVMPAGSDAEAKTDMPVDVADPSKADKKSDKNQPADDDQDDAGNPVGDLLSGLGGGLPVPLPF